jgi:hypothetical protein
MDKYAVGMLRGFLEAHNASEGVMQAFLGIVHPNYEPVCKSEKPAILPEDKEEKKGWSRWPSADQKKLIQVVKSRKLNGVPVGDIIKELMGIFPDRKYNAVYTKLNALGLITEKVEIKKKSYVAPKKKVIESGEA